MPAGGLFPDTGPTLPGPHATRPPRYQAPARQPANPRPGRLPALPRTLNTPPKAPGHRKALGAPRQPREGFPLVPSGSPFPFSSGNKKSLYFSISILSIPSFLTFYRN